MINIREKFLKKIDRVDTSFIRDIERQIDWNNRLIGVKGARGVGKTTMLLQHIGKSLPSDQRTVYVSLDDIWFSANSLVDFTDLFVKNGGEFLILDEVHHYRNWSQEIKNIYDDHPDLKIIFTGSSIIHLGKSQADLSRRAVIYEMHGLSFREYIKLNNRKDFDVINLKSILKDHVQFSREITGKIKPIQLFNEYLKIGYYPYFIENKDSYHNKLAQTVNLVLEVDLPYAQDISSLSIDKLKKLLYILAVSVPFKPNVLKLSEKTGISRNTIIQFINYLADAKIINLLNSDSSGISQLQKPQKIYLHHPNLLYTLAPENANTGSVRESFFNNQLSNVYKVNYTDKGDFLVNDKYTFEIGGKNKSRKQIADVPDSFIASDYLEIGFRNRIPLWLFGFLY